jgi:uncharacterized protein (TIGR00297 family)
VSVRGHAFGKVKWATTESRAVTGDVRRAVGFFLVGAIGLIAPLLDGHADETLAAVGTVAPFVLVAVVALVSREGRLFETFAHEGDREEGRLYGLASFALAVAGLAILTVGFDLPTTGFVAAVFVFTTGNLAQDLLARRIPGAVAGTTAFAAVGTLGGVASMSVAGLLGAATPSPPLAVFVAASGALLGALIRSALYIRDDSLVLLSGGLVIWLLIELEAGTPGPSLGRVAAGLALTVALGYVAYALGTASITGMLTGVLLAFFAVVLGGYGWFVLLVTFFGLGGLASKYRYDEKLERGIAQENEGARGSGNVLANSAVALVAVIAYAASDHVGMDASLFRVAFAGAVAAALADTFSSEFGGLFDSPRLITTFERVAPGTDGGVTWQGAVAGLAGAAVIGGLGGIFFGFTLVAIALVALAGFAGMTVDSVLGATLEGGRLDNQSVNLLATLSAGLIAAAGGALL